MESIDMKELVRRAIQSEWESFEREHPNLARIVDETLLVQAATEALSQDAEYRAAMARVQSLMAAADAVEAVVLRLVRRWLRGLM